MVSLLDIKLLESPELSQRIFKRILSHTFDTRAAVADVVTFLDDLSLNTREAENYAIAVQHLATQGANQHTWNAILGAVNRALTIGLVSSRQISSIVKSLSGTQIKLGRWGKHDPAILLGYYRDLWVSIGRCDVFGHRHLPTGVSNVFLEALLKIGRHDGTLSLARDIIFATHGTHSKRRFWVPRFIIQWLELSMESTPQSSDYVNELLGHFSRRVVTGHLVSVTEALASLATKEKTALLERWRDCLFKIQSIPNLCESGAWYDLRPLGGLESNNAMDESTSKFSQSHQVLLRLWVLRHLRVAIAGCKHWKWQPTDMPMSYLLDFYYHMNNKSGTEHFLTLLTKGIRELNVPRSGLLLSAVQLKTEETMSKTSRKCLESLESSETSIMHFFSDTHAYNATIKYFPLDYDNLLREIDITSEAFIKNSVELATTGDSKNLWVILRLLRSHTPLKISLSMAGLPRADPRQKALIRWYPELSSPGFPDPRLALEVVNSIAVAFSCSNNVSPRRAFGLVHWIYCFLRRNNAPVEPVFVRAMYHAGIVRYRKAGMKLVPQRFNYILDIVQRFEDPAVVRSVFVPPRFG